MFSSSYYAEAAINEIVAAEAAAANNSNSFSDIFL